MAISNLYKDVLKLYSDTHSLVRHHISSYNDFINVKIKEIVETHGQIRLDELNWFMKLSNVQVEKPIVTENKIECEIYPQQCRIRSITYASKVKVDVTFTKPDKSGIKKVTNVLLCSIPVMLKSDACRLNGLSNEELVKVGECPLDPGGYFICKGSEKVFLMQEQMVKNRMILDKMSLKANKKLPTIQKFGGSDIVCYVVSTTVEKKTKTTVFKNHGYFYVENTLFIEPVPIFILFAAFNMPFPYDIYEAVGLEQEIQNELQFSCNSYKEEQVYSQEDALIWLQSRIKKRDHFQQVMKMQEGIEKDNATLEAIKEALRMKVLQHIPGGVKAFPNRARYLGLMIRRIILAEKGKMALDDRDFYGVKRLDLIGDFLSLAFEDKLISFMSTISRESLIALRRTGTKMFSPISYMRPAYLTQGIMGHITSGNWNLIRYNMRRAGVTQDLNRLSFLATLGHLARINSNFERVKKASGARAIHPSQYGYVCPADTPEGEQCGLVKNLSFLVEVTVDVEEKDLMKLITSMPQYGDDLSSFRHCNDKYIVLLNGVPLGWTCKPKELRHSLVHLRRTGVIPHHVSIFFNSEENMLHVSCDGGRMVRPYIVVEDGKSLVTEEVINNIKTGKCSWKQLITQGIIEYLDSMESYSECLVAQLQTELTIRHTHLDIDPATLLGSVASIIPFPHHNQSPRNTYQCAMGKQALGIITTNQQDRFDSIQHVLASPQRPLTLGTVGELIGYGDLPAGQNAIVAITTMGGFDIEDAVIVNRASLDRGIFRSITRKSFKTELKSTNEKIGTSNIPSFREKSLDVDGLPAVGSIVYDHDVIINKLVPADTEMEFESANAGAGNSSSTNNQANNKTPVQLKPEPVCYIGLEPSQCKKCIITENEDGNRVVRVTTVQMRRPEVGDKLSSRHGQKGVIGRIVDETDMPYSEDGIVPDVIMNPHGFPSRMTVGKLIELIANKAACFDGKFRNSSAFYWSDNVPFDDGEDIVGKDEYGAVLLDRGFNMNGKETLYCPRTGNMLEADVFMGPIFYQRLKHMVQDKVHARSKGKNVPLTRQPTEGRSKEGGLRVGEMERDCLIAYGASQTIQERMMLSSDPFRAFVCETCNLLAASASWCHMCRSSQNIASVMMPYATKLLLQELMAINIRPRLTLTDCT